MNEAIQELLAQEAATEGFQQAVPETVVDVFEAETTQNVLPSQHLIESAAPEFTDEPVQNVNTVADVVGGISAAEKFERIVAEAQKIEHVVVQEVAHVAAEVKAEVVREVGKVDVYLHAGGGSRIVNPA